MPLPSGLLNVSKPGGMTSRAVVDRVQRLVRPAKAGHAGTLDPLASGVLVVGVGAGTRLIEYVQRMPKRYRGTFLLGRRSPTEDIEGEIEILPDPPIPSRVEIEQAARRLTGEIMQRPPDFSALKIAGQRAYDLARAGKTVVLEPRPVTIYELRVIAYDYPEFSLDICCSGGTYVRSLGRDLAEALGSAAVMSALVREAIGDFTIAEALPLAELSAETIDARLLPLERARRGPCRGSICRPTNAPGWHGACRSGGIPLARTQNLPASIRTAAAFRFSSPAPTARWDRTAIFSSPTAANVL